MVGAVGLTSRDRDQIASSKESGTPDPPSIAAAAVSSNSRGAKICPPGNIKSAPVLAKPKIINETPSQRKDAHKTADPHSTGDTTSFLRRSFRSKAGDNVAREEGQIASRTEVDVASDHKRESRIQPRTKVSFILDDDRTNPSSSDEWIKNDGSIYSDFMNEGLSLDENYPLNEEFSLDEDILPDDLDHESDDCVF